MVGVLGAAVFLSEMPTVGEALGGMLIIAGLLFTVSDGKGLKHAPSGRSLEPLEGDSTARNGEGLRRR